MAEVEAVELDYLILMRQAERDMAQKTSYIMNNLCVDHKVNNAKFLKRYYNHLGNGFTYLANGNEIDGRMFADRYPLVNKANFYDVIEELGDNHNVYCRPCLYGSQSYRDPKTNKLATLCNDNISKVMAIVLDLDPIEHSIAFTDDEVRKIVTILHNEFRANCIVRSGRGLQVWWWFKHNLDKSRLDEYRNVRTHLKEELQNRLSDLVKIDTVNNSGGGQCRLPGSVNQKNGVRANVIFWLDFGFNFDTLKDIYYREPAKEKTPRKAPNKPSKPLSEVKAKEIKLVAPTTEEKGVMASYGDYMNYVHYLRDDLITINTFYAERGTKINDLILFNYALVLKKLFSFDKALTLLFELNDCFAEPSAESDIMSAMQSVWRYNYKVPTGYEIAKQLLDNDFHEWRKEYPNNMTVCSKEEWQAKQKEKQKIGSKISNAKKKAKRASAKAERNTLIQEYHKQGYSSREIAGKLNCSDKTVRTVLKEG